MNLPKDNFKVKVGALTFDVIWDNNVANEGNCFGSTHNNQQNIFLDPKTQKQDKIEQTFIHELLHACCYVSGITYEKVLTEEKVVRNVSMVLYQVMKDNKELFL